MSVVRVPSVVWVSSASTSTSRLRSACSQICSAPVRSSKRNILAWLAAPPLLERVRMPLAVALAGSSQGGIWSLL
ncbi:Uncharacterised protein [Mycobacterium tuberculosis]|nr:Uncharacterised protein [Mycobacterium tuberculosis]